MSGDRADRAGSYRVHLWLKRGINLNHRDLGMVDVTLRKGYLVDLAGEIPLRPLTRSPASTVSSLS